MLEVIKGIFWLSMHPTVPMFVQDFCWCNTSKMSVYIFEHYITTIPLCNPY